MVTPLVTFRTLVDNSVVALTGSHDTIAVDAKKVEEYMSKMKELTKGTDVEFNNTFRQFCKDRVFYAFEPIEYYNVESELYVPEIVECVLLSDDRVAMNINGNVTIMFPEENNKMYATKEDAEASAKENAKDATSDYLDFLFNSRKELKAILAELNTEIDRTLKFKKSL